MSSFRNSLRNIAVALVIGAMGTGSILAGEVCNSYLPLPSYNVNVYNITFVGNVINQLDLGRPRPIPTAIRSWPPAEPRLSRRRLRQ